MTAYRAVFTVTVETKPDGDYYFDHADFVRHVGPWIEGGLDDRDDIRTVTITEQPADRAAVLSDTERQFLTFALDQAAEEMSLGDGFTDEDRAALEKLRRMAGEAQQPETQSVDDVFELPGPEVVAYRNPDRPSVLLCREHGDGWWGLTPLTSDDLPDGGTCTYGDPADPGDVCGRDVLITEERTS
jgi:hypothetical protein